MIEYKVYGAQLRLWRA